MNQARFGELLGRLVNLSSIDVNEILEEQATSNSRRHFGEIALSWGLCQPEHVWQAWSEQLGDGTQQVDLEKFGIDSQATELLAADTARRLGVIAIRTMGQMVVIAVPNTISEETLVQLRPMLPGDVRFVRADEKQVTRAIERYYGCENRAA